MNKNIVTIVASSALSLLVALGLIRWLAPELLGISPSLQLVKVDKEVPPFYDNIFRSTDYLSQQYIINDPFVNRAKPLYPDVVSMGPNDLLGFRNRQIPNVADIVIIGDSQTYGNNAPLEQNWPNQMAQQLGDKSPVVYSMATGGWGAVEYLEIFAKAKYFIPRVVVVAFYTGNDPLESFMRVYGGSRWDHLKPDSSLSKKQAPAVKHPAPESEWWKVKFDDGIETIFTPKLRHGSNMDHPAVKAGYRIMLNVAEEIIKITAADRSNTKVIFTIIPTKELVYARKIEGQGVINSDYSDLIRDERKNIDNLELKLKAIPGAIYIDVVSSLQQAALLSVPLYPKNINGHPISNGYKVIAEVIAKNVDKMIPAQPEGALFMRFGQNSQVVFLVKDKKRWSFKSKQIFDKNGWRNELLKEVQLRDVANIPYGGIINSVEKKWQPE